MKQISTAIVLAFALVTTASAEDQITKPIRYTWIATSCETWDCALAALVAAKGEPSVIALPTGQESRPWVVLRRVEEGSIFVPEDEPFSCEVFENVTYATSRYAAMSTCHCPMMLSVPDGRAVITMIQKCDESPKRRAVR